MHSQLLLGQHQLFPLGAADFDGSAARMARGAGLTGAADSKTGIFSSWLRLDSGGDGTNRYFLQSGSAGVGRTTFVLLSTNIFSFVEMNAAAATILQISSTTAYTSGATWLNVLASWDLAANASHLYINDVSDQTVTTRTNDTIDYTDTNWFAGSSNFGDFWFNGCMAEFYYAPGQYLDFSTLANRRKFIDANRRPVSLGTTGGLPTGTDPLIYFHLDKGEAVANFATNRGTGGNFSITGTLTAASTSPSD